MRRNLLLSVLIFSLVLFFSNLGVAATNDFTLVGTDLEIHPCVGGGTVEIDIQINTAVNNVVAVLAILNVSGTANPVLDTALTGGIVSGTTYGMNFPALVWDPAVWSQRIVSEAEAPINQFVAISFGNGLPLPTAGLFCKTFWDVTGPGTIVIDTATSSTFQVTGMNDPNGSLAITWGGPYTFNITREEESAPVVNCPGTLNNFVGKIVDVNINATDAGGTPIVDIFLQGALPFGTGSFLGTNPWVYSWDTNDPLAVAGTYALTFGVYDECETTYCTTQVTLIATVGFIRIGVVDGEPCEVVSVPVEMQPNNEFGAFNFYIEFDPTVLYFLGVEKGPGLPQGWEYFTYRQLPCPMCGCCKYKLQIFGLADIKNLTLGETIKPDTGWITIAYLKFKIACDENLRGTEPNICFEFDDEICTENTLSDPTGNVLYVSDNPDFYGPPCPVADDETIIAKVTFVLRSQGELPGTKPCGGVNIGEAAEYARGDINLNGIAYEPADLTLFSNALIYGKGVFVINQSVQLLKTDINADGFVLSMTDFILMIRIILHDATPIPKPAPGSDLATIYVTQGKVSTNATLGAALFTFKGEGTVSSNLTFEQGVVDGNMRVLVYMNSGAGVTGELLTVSGATLDKVEAVDNFGRPVKTTVVNKVIPTAFALYANYPNPFNPTTNISFALPIDSKVSLKLYNVAGQLVRTLVNETMPAGNHTVTWDGSNSNGEKVASGIYFYKLNAGDFSKTMKMVMTK